MSTTHQPYEPQLSLESSVDKAYHEIGVAPANVQRESAFGDEIKVCYNSGKDVHNYFLKGNMGDLELTDLGSSRMAVRKVVSITQRVASLNGRHNVTVSTLGLTLPHLEVALQEEGFVKIRFDGVNKFTKSVK